MTFSNQLSTSEGPTPLPEFAHGASLGMIDIHTHVLPGFDDGATSPAESVEMVSAADADGIAVLFATPHSAFLVGKTYGRPEIEDAVDELQRESSKQHIPVTVLPGIEVHLTPEIYQDLDTGRAFPLNGSRYILLELPFSGYPLSTEQVVTELQRDRGLVPIIVHPERLECCQRDPELLRRLIDLGALSQLTAGSLTGRFGSTSQRLSRIMLEHGWVHFLASDSHDSRQREPRLSDALAAAAELIGEEAARDLVIANPRAIVEDVEIQRGEPLAYEAKRRRWLIR